MKRLFKGLCEMIAGLGLMLAIVQILIYLIREFNLLER